MITQLTDGAMCHTGYNYNGYGYNNNNGYNCDSDLINGQREIVKSIYDSENDVRTNLDSIGALITDGQSRLTTNVNTVSRDVLNTQHDLSKEIGDNKFFTATGFSDLRQELSSVNNDLNKQIAHLSFENHKAESRTREELLKGFASTQLDACKNTSELAKQIAECCCETQKAILAQSASIRELGLTQSASIRELDLNIENRRLQALVNHTQHNASNNNIEIAITNVLRNLNIKS